MPNPRRTVRLPRPRVQPLSTVRAPFFRSAQFYVRVGVLSMVALAAFAFLALRLWSLQVLNGAEYASTAQRQIIRTVDLPGARGQLVDARGRPLATTGGWLVVAANADALGRLDLHGRWHPSASGLRTLGRLHRLTGVPVGTLVARIRASGALPRTLRRGAADARLSSGRARQRVPRPARRGEPCRVARARLPPCAGRRACRAVWSRSNLPPP